MLLGRVALLGAALGCLRFLCDVLGFFGALGVPLDCFWAVSVCIGVLQKASRYFLKRGRIVRGA